MQNNLPHDNNYSPNEKLEKALELKCLILQLENPDLSKAATDALTQQLETVKWYFHQKGISTRDPDSLIETYSYMPYPSETTPAQPSSSKKPKKKRRAPCPQRSHPFSP
jgi:hypothetical protein